MQTRWASQCDGPQSRLLVVASVLRLILLSVTFEHQRETRCFVNPKSPITATPLMLPLILTFCWLVVLDQMLIHLSFRNVHANFLEYNFINRLMFTHYVTPV